jgi:hypothetical protein
LLRTDRQWIDTKTPARLAMHQSAPMPSAVDPVGVRAAF